MKTKLFVVVLFLVAISSTAQVRVNRTRNTPIQKLLNVEMAINQLYVDSVDEGKLVEDAIRGMLKGLDPHSSYATKEEIMRRLRGPKGTKVRIGIRRQGFDEELQFTVKRDKIPMKSIIASYMLRPGVGYIRIGNFGATTYDEFMESLQKLQKNGMKSLVLDLQENGGGYMKAAVDVANEFLQSRDLIVYTDGRERSEYRAKGNGRFRTGTLIVLVDEYTASAAEIVTGAIQDQDRGLVVGRRTFGKGLVQRQITLPDTSMIRLTIAHYYTPSGRCIQKPYVKGQGEDYAQDMQNRLRRGELMNADSIHFADSLRYYTLRQHRTVYGGGGIMPDQFVPLDTTIYTRFHRALQARNLVINANLRYVDDHRRELKKQYSRVCGSRATLRAAGLRAHSANPINPTTPTGIMPTSA